MICFVIPNKNQTYAHAYIRTHLNKMIAKAIFDGMLLFLFCVCFFFWSFAPIVSRMDEKFVESNSLTLQTIVDVNTRTE